MNKLLGRERLSHYRYAQNPRPRRIAAFLRGGDQRIAGGGSFSPQQLDQRQAIHILAKVEIHQRHVESSCVGLRAGRGGGGD